MDSIINEATSNALSRLSSSVTSEITAISGRLSAAKTDNAVVTQAVNDLERLNANVSTEFSHLLGNEPTAPAGTPSSAASSSTDTASTRFEHPI